MYGFRAHILSACITLCMLIGLMLYATSAWRLVLDLLICASIAMMILGVVWLLVRRTHLVSFRTLLLILITLAGALLAISHVIKGKGSPWVLFLAIFVVVTVFASVRIDYRRRLRWQRIQNQLCEVCGYDIRASEDRCPECGAEIPSHYAWYRSTHIAGMLPEGIDEDAPTPPAPDAEPLPPASGDGSAIWYYQPSSIPAAEPEEKDDSAPSKT